MTVTLATRKKGKTGEAYFLVRLVNPSLGAENREVILSI